MKSFFQHLLTLVLISVGVSTAQAQYEPAVFDYENGYFNNGQPLKAEHFLMFTGPISRKVQRVEVSAYRGGSKHKSPLYVATWMRSFGNLEESFNLPFNFKLKGDASYDMVMDYYREVAKEEKDQIRQALFQSVDSYLEQNFSTNGRRVKLVNSVDAVVSDLNTIAKESFNYYRNESEVLFPGFSDIVKRGIENMIGRRLRNAEARVLKDGDDNNKDARSALFVERMDELKKVIHNELDQVLNTHLMIRSDSRQVVDYPTEHTRNELAINVGYGAAYFGGNWDNLNYRHGLTSGLSFPLGNSSMSGRFWSNSSITLGAFWKNFQSTNANGETTTITGPIFGRPYYVAYGYRVFRFLRVNAGAVALQTDTKNNTVTTINRSSLQVRPFIGLSAELRFWMGLGK